MEFAPKVYVGIVILISSYLYRLATSVN